MHAQEGAFGWGRKTLTLRRATVLALAITLLAIPSMSGRTMAATPSCGGHTATIVGTKRPDIIRGTNHRDIIVAKGGKDVIHARGGKDIVCAGRGSDVVSGGPGDDTIRGQAGNDLVRGKGGFDSIDGGSGSDRCLTGGGGGQLMHCETADLGVLIESPAAATPGVPFTFDVTVINHGPDAASYVLRISRHSTDATCSGLKPGKYPKPTLPVGGMRVWHVHQSCSITGPLAQVSVTARVRASAIDPNPISDSDTSSTAIVEP